MLELIKINDYALIEECEIEFGPNFNVVTGESGAGKSILMGAVAFLLGNRTDRSVIRTGSSRATVTGCFVVPEELRANISRQLEECGVEFDTSTGLLSLRRVILSSSTRNFINDTPVGAKTIAEIGEQLIDLHGANEHLSLTSPAHQLQLLDHYLGLEEERKSCSDAWDKLQQLKNERSDFSSDLPTAAEMEHLQNTIDEINAVNPVPGEDEELAAKHKIGASAREIISSANELANLLNESENSVADQLGSAFQKLQELARIDENLVSGLIAECGDIQERTSELARSIAALAEKVELDPEELLAIENRMEDIFKLKRRYAPDIGLILEIRDKAVEKLERGRNAEAQMREFEKREKELTAHLQECCSRLSRSRRNNADKFTDAVAGKLQSIGFFRSSMSAEFSDAAPSPNGADQMELFFSANPGEAPKPLRKIASSGELSRIMLALKTILADADSIPTVIFDEIDMNIGGETANRVGDELKSLGKHRQILCISHLAQVAARADVHFQVVKTSSENSTRTHVRRLDSTSEELARMLGGGAAAIEHARTLGRQE